MGLSDIVNVVISAAAIQLTRVGFGVPLILSSHSLFADLVREYDGLDGLVTDGFTSSTPEYKAANAIFAQSPRPPTLKVGRRAHKPTLRYTLTPVVVDSTVYTVEIDGIDYTFTSGVSTTATLIVTGLKAAIGSLSGITLGGTTTLTISASAAGGWFDVDADRALLAIACDNASPSELADDLTAINLADDQWYGLVSVFRSLAEIEVIATWVEAHDKLFCAASSDTAIYDGSSTTDVAYALKHSAYFRSCVFYHPNPDAFADAALMGRVLPLTPGSETWKFKTLAGVPAVILTPAQKAAILAKNAMVYTTLGGVPVTEEGKVAAGEWIDTIRFRDWITARLQEDVFSLLARSDKLPFTDGGIAGVESVVKSVLAMGVDSGGFSSDPAPSVTVPRAADVSVDDRAARRLPNVRWAAQLAGAIHATDLRGTITA